MDFVIAEFDHFEPIYGLLKCISPVANSVRIYAPERFVVRLRNINFEIADIQYHIADNPEELFKYNIEQRKGAVLIIAPSSHFESALKFIEILSPSKTLLWIRNINFWFQMGTRYKLFKRPRSPHHKVMLDVAGKADYLVVESDTLERFLRKKTNEKYKTVIFPYSIYETNLQGSGDEGKLTISLPGYIEESRRDYRLALSAFAKVSPTQFKLKILGQARDGYGEQIIKQAQQLVSEGYQISFLDTPDRFEEEIINSDVIFAPLNVNTGYSGIDEVYGKSKESGVTYDVVRYSKPAVFPYEMDLPAELSECVLKYSSEEQLVKIFNELCDKEYYDRLKTKALEASRKYEVGVVSKSLLNTLR